ncbi:MAG TPA: PPC domain-containing DNA-binding protein [Spirochaetia bacterium]|nr:PPC domain-containing DNA-binding protein [Spirochaetia bacterium]
MCMDQPSERRFSGRLPHGSDLLAALTDFCSQNNILHGGVQGLGALSRARVAFYDQKEQVYHEVAFDNHLEILTLMGNVSLRDGRPFVHAHVVLADESGRAFGGHLVEGCTVFACEFAIQEWQHAPAPERQKDPVTGLWLWP